ncbi:DUF5696 domain-containing protein [Bacillaceae bacterium S4-13-56]
MSKKRKWVVFVLIFLFPIPILANTFDEPKQTLKETRMEQTDDLLKYNSNAYTQPENEQAKWKNDASLEGYTKVSESSDLSLYVDKVSLGLKIVNKATGYIWSSGLEQNKEYKLNDSWINMANSAVTIEYINPDGKLSSESLLTDQSDVSFKQTDEGFSATITLKQSGITVPLDVTLEGKSLNIEVPEEGIVEQENKLATMKLYPFLGAVEGTDHDGYLFIPDGSGALIRFVEKQPASTTPFRASVYGKDEGFTRSSTGEKSIKVNPVQQVRMPVYGVTHGVDENGFVTIIDKGKNYAEVLAYPSGVSTDFYWITTQYNYRYQYYQPTSQNMSGYNVYQEERNAFDIKETVTFLEGDDANYVGMAHVYQNYLIENNMLKEKDDHVDARLEFLGGEVKDGLLWDSVYPMTQVKDLPEYVTELKEQGVDEMNVVYRGWTDGGFTGTLPQKFPLEDKLGSDEDFADVRDFFSDQGIPLYFFTDYSKAYKGASGYSGRTDIARKINAEPIVTTGEFVDYYLLSPNKSLEIAKADNPKYKENGITNLAIDSSASMLFSDFNHDIARPEAVNVYQELFATLQENVDSIALYQPNDYMLSITDRYLDIPMYASNYIFVTDTVPFVQIVLKGYIPYYSSYSNFFYNPDDEVLRMIEYGAYPSFYLTTEPSHELMYTPSRDLYTSQFSDWKSEIVDQYKAVKGTLGEVEGAHIISRHVHDTGVVEVGYSNNKSILVNYTNKAVIIQGVEVEAKGYKVIDRGNQS